MHRARTKRPRREGYSQPPMPVKAVDKLLKRDEKKDRQRQIHEKRMKARRQILKDVNKWCHKDWRDAQPEASQ